MVSWTISAAIKAKLIDHVVVSSDSVKIIRIAKKYGALAPFVRPKIFKMIKLQIIKLCYIH